MAAISFEIRLRNVEGIPVIQLGGTITETAVRGIRSTLERLANAGHYQVVLNVERVKSADWSFLGSLSDAVARIRGHYGSVDLVVAQDALARLVSLDGLSRLYRFCSSEAQAISQIKGLTRQPERLRNIGARILEQS